MVKVSQGSVLILCLLFFIILSWVGLMRAEDVIVPDGSFSQETVAFPEAITYVDTVKQLEEQVGTSVSTFNVLPDSFERISMGYKKIGEESFLTRQTFIRYPDGKMTFEQGPKFASNEVISSQSTDMTELMVNGQVFHMNIENEKADYVIWEKGANVYAVSTNETFSVQEWEILLSSLQ
ncbi:hypothetical protein N780_00715 [Pontibacillus chungwhensis BH030062]|uniref:DUF4367 domain-containing protein n=1 Tax=Pontibacillus chungwhensis BH030062 TaxID=1385513 RepID=A0A0A2UVS7_9BACI|nr:hypothetical protein [Pontibacillus chungwhensis]KGP92357.1 hypothetical protein N780_00715 [Pontibacillus chungwhensis BH030062]